MRKPLRALLPILIIMGGFAVLAVLVVSKPSVKTAAPQSARPLVRVMTVAKQDLPATVKSQGAVVPRTESTLVSQVAGRVVSVSSAFAAGGFFEKGDVLMRIDDRDYALAVTGAQAQVAQAELRLKLQEEEAEVAVKEWGRIGQGEPSDLVMKKPQIAEARAGLEASKANLEMAKLNLERTKIRAPYAGRVRNKQADVGQFVNPGSPVAMIYAVDYAEVRLPLPDEQLAFLEIPLDFRGAKSHKRGPAVTLKANFAGKEHAWQGYIARLEGEVDQRTRMVYAVARVENPYGASDDSMRPPLAVGMFVHAEIQGKIAEDVVLAPRAAIRNGGQLLVVDSEDRLHFREVEILRFEDANAVIQSGLEAGERICLSTLTAVVEGMPVRISDEN